MAEVTSSSLVGSTSKTKNFADNGLYHLEPQADVPISENSLNLNYDY